MDKQSPEFQALTDALLNCVQKKNDDLLDASIYMSSGVVPKNSHSSGNPVILVGDAISRNGTVIRQQNDLILVKDSQLDELINSLIDEKSDKIGKKIIINQAFAYNFSIEMSPYGELIIKNSNADFIRIESQYISDLAKAIVGFIN